MKIYIISDTHFGHKKIVEYCGRPENHSEILLENLQKLPKDAILIHLGDICIGDDKAWHESISNLEYKKILVKGNHDHRSLSWYMSHGWDFACDSLTMSLHKHNILFSHKPKRIHDGIINVHGHLHNSLVFGHKPADYWVEHEIGHLTDEHLLYSPELRNYKPLLLDTMINEYTKIRDSSSQASGDAT